MIPFNKASMTELEERYLLDALRTSKSSGDGTYTFRVYDQFRERFGIERMLLTTSGTAALEMASILIDLQPGDEVIVPSFTFSSTVNAFLLRGAVPVFCDVRPDTMNMDETLVEGLVTDRTRAVYAIDYAGVPAEMDAINEVAARRGLFVIEDAAQAVGSTYKGRPAGTLSEFGCYSFHETKNYVMGEGGAIVLNEGRYLDRAEIVREKGTNRRHVLRGWTDKYTWHDVGSSYLPSDLLAALLCAQMERYDEIMAARMRVWQSYQRELAPLEERGRLRRLSVPSHVVHNAHMYNIVLPDEATRTRLVEGLKERDVMAYICYVPLHSAPMGLKLGNRPEDCPVTEDLGKRTLRLPLYADMTESDVDRVLSGVFEILS